MDDLPDFNVDEWAKMFGTSTYCTSTQDDTEAFDLTHLAQATKELNKPMFDNFIQQDIALVPNPLTQPYNRLTQKLLKEKIRSNKKTKLDRC